MRTLLILATLATALAGCSGDSDSGMPDDDTWDIQLVRDLPANFTATQTVTGSFDPLNFAQMPVCSTPTAACSSYDFVVNASMLPSNVTAEQAEGRNTTAAPMVELMADLNWGLPASDFDLYLFQDGTQLLVSGQTPPGTNEFLTASLDAGTYTVVVVAWLVIQDTFTLDVTFS